MWTRNGRALLYRTARGIEEVALTTGSTFGIAARRVVMADTYPTNGSHQNWDLSADGQSFLLLEPVVGQEALVLVHNWVRTLRGRLAGKPE